MDIDQEEQELPKQTNVRELSREAAKELRRFIEDSLSRRDLRPGDKLPNERELATRFKTGRNTIRRTLIEFEKDGLIERTVGRGTFVRAEPLVSSALFGSGFDNLGGVIAKSASPLDLMEFRIAVEPDIAAYSVGRAAMADIEKMQAAIDASRTAKSLQEFEDLDDALHRAIAASSRNPLFVSASNLISAVRTQPEWGGVKKRTLSATLRELHTKEHVAIVEAIRQRDAAAAREAMRKHLVNVQAMMFPPGSQKTAE